MYDQSYGRRSYGQSSAPPYNYHYEQYAPSPTNYAKSSNHREMEPLEDKERGCCQGFVAFLLGLALFSSQLVIFGVVALTVYWVFKFKGGIDLEKDPLQQFNTHIIAMILCGTICISAGFYVTYMNTHNKAQNHFRSLHTWLALATCSLFCLQFVFAILFFIIPLCCRRKTFAFRQKMMPVHASFGLILFTMFSGTAITGFMQAQEEPLILPPTYNQTAENILSLIPGKPEQQSDLIVKILGCGILVLGVFLSAVTNTSIRGGRGVFYRT